MLQDLSVDYSRWLIYALPDHTMFSLLWQSYFQSFHSTKVIDQIQLITLDQLYRIHIFQKRIKIQAKSTMMRNTKRTTKMTTTIVDGLFSSFSTSQSYRLYSLGIRQSFADISWQHSCRHSPQVLYYWLLLFMHFCMEKEELLAKQTNVQPVPSMYLVFVGEALAILSRKTNKIEIEMTCILQYNVMTTSKQCHICQYIQDGQPIKTNIILMPELSNNTNNMIGVMMRPSDYFQICSNYRVLIEFKESYINLTQE